jgi:hypothetical protein
MSFVLALAGGDSGRMVGDLRLPRAQAVRHSSSARGVVYDGGRPGRSLRSQLGLR